MYVRLFVWACKWMICIRCYSLDICSKNLYFSITVVDYSIAMIWNAIIYYFDDNSNRKFFEFCDNCGFVSGFRIILFRLKIRSVSKKNANPIGGSNFIKIENHEFVAFCCCWRCYCLQFVTSAYPIHRCSFSNIVQHPDRISCSFCIPQIFDFA